MTGMMKPTVAFLLIGSWLFAVARAEDPAAPAQQPQTAFEQTPYLSASQAAQASQPANGSDASGGISSATEQKEISDYDATALSSQPDPAQPWQLPQPPILKKLGINMGGWVQQGITYNAWNPAGSFQRAHLHERSQWRVPVESGLAVFRPPHEDRWLRI